jgi:hypothetical protein
MNITQLVHKTRELFTKTPKEISWEGGGEEFALRFRRIIDKDSHLYIVSNGAAEGSSWTREIRTYLQLGCKVSYIYTGLLDEPAENISILEGEFPRQVRVYILSKASIRSVAGRFAKKYFLTHPTLHVHPTKSALWLEWYHPLASPLAFEVEYLEPIDANKDERYKALLEEIKVVTDGQYLVSNTQ